MVESKFCINVYDIYFNWKWVGWFLYVWVTKLIRNNKNTLNNTKFKLKGNDGKKCK